MSRPTSRASAQALDKLHRLTANELSRQLQAAAKEGAPASAALLTAAISFLKAADVTAPAPPRRRPDRLRGVLPDLGQIEQPDHGADFEPRTSSPPPP